MGNLVSYNGELLATYYLEKRSHGKPDELDGHVFEFEGLEALTKLLNAPNRDLTDEGESIGNIKLRLKADNCFGIFLSPEQRYANRCER